MKRKNFLRTYKQAIIAALITLLVVIVGGVLFASLHHRTSNNAPKKEMLAVVASVSKLILLPSGEEPTLASVTDKNQLKKQAIFANAENGDKVLVYTKTQQVYIYRPSINKLVNVGPLILSKTGSTYVTSKVAILNGSGNPDLLNTMSQALTAAFPNITVIAKDTAPRAFPGSITIDLTKTSQPLDEQIADTLGIKAGKLPLGINAPAAADFLIIVGSDYK